MPICTYVLQVSQPISHLHLLYIWHIKDSLPSQHTGDPLNKQSASQSVFVHHSNFQYSNQSGNKSVTQPTNLKANEVICQTVTHSTTHHIIHTTNELLTHTINQLDNHLTNHLFSQSVSEPVIYLYIRSTTYLVKKESK